MDFEGFDWNESNREHCQKHGVSVQEIESLFLGSIFIVPDVGHSTKEKRFLAIGVTAKGRHVFLAFTFRPKRGKLLVRPISARYMHEREIKAYEKKVSKI